MLLWPLPPLYDEGSSRNQGREKEQGGIRMNKWKYAYGLTNRALQLVGWDEALSIRGALKRLRQEAEFFEWRSRKQIVQNQRIHIIEHRLREDWA